MPEELDPAILPAPVQLIAVCHSDPASCPVAGQEFEGTYYPYGTFEPPRYMGQCGRCLTPYTDLRPTINPTPPTATGSDTVPTPEPVEPSSV